MAYWQKAKGAPEFNSPEIVSSSKNMRFLGAKGGIDGALEAAKADARILPLSFVPISSGLQVVQLPQFQWNISLTTLLPPRIQEEI